MRVEYLYNLCEIIGGNPNPQIDSAFSNSEGVPFVKMKDLGKYHLTTNLVDTEKKISSDYAEKKSYKLIKSGSVLLPRSGSVSQNHRAILGVDAYIVSHIFALEIIDNTLINNYYLYYYLLNLDLGLIANKTTGIDSITKERLGLIKIPIPPIDEQNRIISILKVIEVLKEKRKQSINKLDSLLRSVFLELFGDPISNSRNWKTIKKLSELGDWKSGGTPDTNIDEYYIGDIPWLNSGELGNVFVEESKKKISNEAIKNSNAKIIPVNSILIGMYDTAAFKMSINKFECSCNQAVMYSKLDDENYTLFVYYSLNYSKEYYLSKRKGARQMNLNSTFIKEIEIFLPDGKEGLNNINKFNFFHSLVESQKQKIKHSKSVINTLFESSLELSFVGKKVEFDEIEDMINNTEELNDLISLFKNNQFVNQIDYNIKKDLLFKILEKSEKNNYGISQVLFDNEVELKIK
ncbi:restriction endonuclease subunit S [Flavobacterium hauense]